MLPDRLVWAMSALRAWEAIVKDIRDKGGCPHYLQRAERTAEHYRILIERARQG